MKSAYAYARFSSDNQREESIDAQFFEIKKYAESEGIYIKKFYADEAISGLTSQRPQFLEMMDNIMTNGGVDYVIVYKVDRFSRDKYQSAIFKERLSRRGVKVLYAAQRLSDTPEGGLMEGILESFAQYYSDNLSTDTRRGQYNNARNGLFNGGIPPLGYYIDEEKRYQIDEYEAVIVRYIFDLYLQGLSQDKIAEECNLKGYKTKQDNNFSRDSVARILRNKKYVGIYEHGRQTFKYGASGKRVRAITRNDKDVVINHDAIPPIIDEDKFYKVQNRVTERANQRAKHQRYDYPLRGLTHCHCGGKMYGYTPKGKPQYSRYRCKKCYNSIKRLPLESYILTVVRRYILDHKEDIFEKMKAEVEKKVNTQSNTKKALQKRLVEIDKEESNCIEFITKMGANEKLKAKLDELTKEKNSIRNSLESTPNSKDLSKEIRLWLSKIEKHELNMSKKDLMSLMVSKIEVHDEKVEIYFNVPINFCHSRTCTPAYAGSTVMDPLKIAISHL